MSHHIPSHDYAEETIEGIPELDPCPHGLCDGSGKITIGQFDDIQERDCLCEVERRRSNEEDNLNQY